MNFPTNSRYQATETMRMTAPGGAEVVFLQRRFVPQPERLASLLEHPVAEGDRLDNLAGRYLGDAEQFWRICDANRAMRPQQLVETIGRRLTIALPDGVPGAPRV
ncbi:LysM domain-containing protein [Massilia aurea]|uniref:LysM domain-containing protein n=1 Tax=Massilia aurea TaxID=373040 RepID=UPI0034623DD4